MENYKIAIPQKNNQVDNHFGHCDSYALYSIYNNSATRLENFAAPKGCGCKSNIAEVLSNMGVKIILAGNMGDGALRVLTQANIEVYRGLSGNTDDLTLRFLAGSVVDSGKGCSSHNQHHADGNNHTCNH